MLASSRQLGSLSAAGPSLSLNSQPWSAALYRSFATASSAGIANEPTNNAGRVITVLLTVFGASLYLFAGAMIFDAVAKRFFSASWAARRGEKRFRSMKNHYILCGYGRVGEAVANELRRSNIAYLVVKAEGERTEAIRQAGELVLEGDATDPEVLLRAGLERARGVIAALDSDAKNLYVVLVANNYNPDLFIAARASGRDAAEQLLTAGADRIVSPYEAAGNKLAAMAANHQVENYVDLSLYSSANLRLAQLRLGLGAWATGKTIAQIEAETEVSVVALIEGPFLEPHPAADSRLVSDEVVIVLGTQKAVDACSRHFV